MLRIVDAGVEPGEQAVEMILERVGDLDHVLEPRLQDLLVPEREVRLRPVLVASLPEPSEEFLQRPRLARVERAFQKVVALRRPS